MPSTSAFTSAILLKQTLYRRRKNHPPTCNQSSPSPPPASGPPSDQYSQYAARNKAFLIAEQARLRQIPLRHRHHHIFLQSPSATALRAAAARYLSSRPPSDTRLWVLRSTADPTFGTLRGEPFPPRVALLETISLQDDQLKAGSVSHWIAALDRAGKALSPMDSHYVDWALCGREGPDEKDVSAPAVVAFEILNADWTRPESIAEMRDALLSHAVAVVSAGNAIVYEVLQSVDEPTCFKTVEMYTSLDALKDHMNTIDPPFEEDMLRCRAAVNRVRQLYNPLFSAPS